MTGSKVMKSNKASEHVIVLKSMLMCGIQVSRGSQTELSLEAHTSWGNSPEKVRERCRGAGREVRSQG